MIFSYFKSVKFVSIYKSFDTVLLLMDSAGTAFRILISCRVSQRKFTRLVGCKIKSMRPIFNTGVLGTVQSLSYNMAGAKRNGAITFFELAHNWVNTFY